MSKKEHTPRVTLDTNVLFEFWTKREKRDVAEQLLNLSDEDRIDLAVTTRIKQDIPYPRLSERVKELPTMDVRTVGSVFRVGVSVVGSEDTVTDGHYRETQEIIESKLRARGQCPPQTADFDHIFGHHIANRDVFLTWDGGILIAAEYFADSLGVRIQTPEDFIAELNEEDSQPNCE